MLKRILNKFTGRAPDWAAQAIGRYPHIEDHEHYHLKRVAHDILGKTGGEVFSGPLAGMKIPLDSPLSDLPMYVIGCYEQEIHPVLLDVICSPPPQIIDIGSAYGYYTVGLALQTAKTHLIGFEAAEASLWSKSAELAKLNGVHNRITQKGFCDVDALSAVAREGDFIICDCEGGELILLDPDKIPVLRECTMLCELHDFLAPGVTATLVERFNGTHRIKLILEQPRDPSQYRILDGLSEAYRSLAVKETRHLGQRLTPLKFLQLTPN